MATRIWICAYCCGAVVVLLALVVGLWMRDVNHMLGEWKLAAMHWNDASCRVIGADLVRGGDDLALWRNGVAIVSAGDLGVALSTDPAEATGTGVFAVDLRAAAAAGRADGPDAASDADVVRRVELLGFPAGEQLVGHGMFLSNASGRAYFINHGSLEVGKSFIEIFGIEGEDFKSLRLRHLSRISSPLLLAGGINDVVEGRGLGEVFVSVWRHYRQTHRVKANGPENADAAILGLMKYRYFGTDGNLGVLRCIEETDGEGALSEASSWSCDRTSAWNMVSANGLAISPERDLLLVSCTECQEVLRYVVSSSGKLHEIKPRIQMPSPVDNMEWDKQTGRVICGGIPVPGRVDKRAQAQPGEVLDFATGDLATEGRHPGIRSLLRHDGSRIRGSSAAVRYGKALLVGQSYEPGLLYCSKL